MANMNVTINGLRASHEVEDRTTLADFLRNQQHLTGTHLGCEHGVCGACTVLLDGVPVRSCIAYVPILNGRDVRTIEGFDDHPVMQGLRKAFNEEHGLQCGYCTPGMLITAFDIVTRFPDADEKHIRTELSGNLCRCTGYQGIVNAIQRVMREMPATQRVNGCPAAAPRPPVFGPLRRFTPAPETTSPTARQPSIEISALKDGWLRVTDSFILPKSAEEVWAAFADIPKVTLCMPGASFTEVSGNDVKGTLRVGFGPIKAEFACTATIERDDEQMCGTLRGVGGDRRGGTQAQGKVTYNVSRQGRDRAQVAVTVDYQLQGALAQFSRSGLVKDFARMMISDFAQNLSASLGGAHAVVARASRFNVAGLMWRTLKVRLRALFAR
jgi:carbon-monoxide dehydrogenase small subunit